MLDISAECSGGERRSGKRRRAEGGMGTETSLQPSVKFLIEGTQNNPNVGSLGASRQRDLHIDEVAVNTGNDRARSGNASFAQNLGFISLTHHDRNTHIQSPGNHFTAEISLDHHYL